MNCLEGLGRARCFPRAASIEPRSFSCMGRALFSNCEWNLRCIQSARSGVQIRVTQHALCTRLAWAWLQGPARLLGGLSFVSPSCVSARVPGGFLVCTAHLSPTSLIFGSHLYQSQLHCPGFFLCLVLWSSISLSDFAKAQHSVAVHLLFLPLLSLPIFALKSTCKASFTQEHLPTFANTCYLSNWAPVGSLPWLEIRKMPSHLAEVSLL